MTSLRLLATLAVAGGLVSDPLGAQTAAARRPGTQSPVLDMAAMSEALEAVVERVKPGVVQILATGYAAGTKGTEPLLARQRATGSGVILDPEGYVLTNAHVVTGAQRLDVMLPGIPASPRAARSVLRPLGRVAHARLVGVDEETDLAVLKVDATGLPALPLGDSETLRQGQIVLAVGSPLGLENSVSLGIVSAVARQLEPESPMIYVQTDASINPGNSGGPLVDVEGRVVGINTLILSQSGGSEGIGFAAPSNIARNVFDQIRKTGRVSRGEIGLRTQTVTPELARALGLSRDWGVVVADVTPKGPSAEAGLQIGDLVTTLDGKPMENARQFNVNLYRRLEGAGVILEVLRGDDKLRYVVTVRERSDDMSQLASLVTPERNVVMRLGILALDLDDTLAPRLPALRARAGVVVAASTGESATGDPLRPGDVIYALNGKPVAGIEALRAALASLKAGDPVVLLAQRGTDLRYFTMPPE